MFVPMCLCLVQLLVLLDKCHGRHLDPKPEINLAYNISLRDRQDWEKCLLARKRVRPQLGYTSSLHLPIPHPLSAIALGLRYSSSRPVVVMIYRPMLGCEVCTVGICEHNWALEFYWALCVNVCVHACRGWLVVFVWCVCGITYVQGHRNLLGVLANVSLLQLPVK